MIVHCELACNFIRMVCFVERIVTQNIEICMIAAEVPINIMTVSAFCLLVPSLLLCRTFQVDQFSYVQRSLAIETCRL